jgi:hypothetical protein
VSRILGGYDISRVSTSARRRPESVRVNGHLGSSGPGDLILARSSGYQANLRISSKTVYARQTACRLGMLAAGVILGCLASVGWRSRAKVLVQAEPVRPSQGTSTGTVAKGRPRTKKRAILTNNAVVAGVVSAIVAGVISFAVAHYQAQDADRQAVASQQVAIASEVESEATRFSQDINSAFQWHVICYKIPASACTEKKPDINAVFADEQQLDVALDNISDHDVSTSIQDLLGDASILFIGSQNQNDYLKYAVKATGDYAAVTYYCGQIIQGQ